MMHLNSKKSSRAGFSLVETLVAIAILLIVIVGPMSIASNASQATSYANQQIMAYFLAQEGLELAQKGRDDLVLPEFVGSPLPPANNDGWDDFVDPNGVYEDCYTTAGCGLYISNANDGEISAVDCDTNVTSHLDCQLFINTGSSDRARYTHDDSVVDVNTQASDFVRVITFYQETPGDPEVLITSKVFWRTDNQINQQFTEATSYLYNAYGR